MSSPPDAARRLTWLGLFLAGAIALVLAWTALKQLDDLSAREGEIRVDLLADGIAQQIQRAVALGIPLGRLEGVQGMFAQRIADSRDIEALALVDAERRVLWLQPPQAEALLGSARVTVSPVLLHGRPIAQVLLVRRLQGPAALLLAWAPLLLCAVLVIALTASEAVRYALASGPRLRDGLLRSVCRSVAAGDLSRRMPVLARRGFDSRLQWLAAELRQTNEQHLRLSRLAKSLRQTEPVAQRRAELDAALRHAEGHDLFASSTSREIPPLPYAEGARWFGLLAGWLAWCVAGTVLMGVAPPTAQGLDWIGWGVWGLCMALAAGAALHAVTRLPWDIRRLACQHAAWRRGGLIGGLLVGPGWTLLLLALDPSALRRIEDFLPLLSSTLAIGLALGCLAVLVLDRAALRAEDAGTLDAA